MRVPYLSSKLDRIAYFFAPILQQSPLQKPFSRQELLDAVCGMIQVA